MAAQRRTQALALGVALIVLAPAIGAAAYYLGAWGRIGEPPSREVVDVSAPRYASLCPASESCVSPSGFPGPATQTFVYAGSNGTSYLITGWVENLGWIERISPAGKVEAANTSLSCLPEGAFYPGTGPYIFVSCESTLGSTNSTGQFVQHNVASILYLNWSTGAIDRSIDLASPLGCNSPMAYDALRGWLFCAGGDPEYFVRTFDVATGELVANVSVPSGLDYYPGFMIWDPSDQMLLLPNTSSRGLVGLDPTTGRTSLLFAPQSYLFGATLDLAQDRLYLATSGTLPTDGTLLALNASTLAVISSFEVPGLFNGPIYSVPSRGMLFLPVTDQILNTSTGAVAGTLPLGDYVPSTTFAFNPATSQILQMSSYFILAEYNATFGLAPEQPFSTWPLVSSSLPVVLSIASAVAGLLVLTPTIVARARRARRTWVSSQDLVAPGEKPVESQGPARPR